MTEKAAKPSALGGLFSTAKSLFVEEVEVPDKASPKPLVTPGTIFSYGPVGQGGSGAAPHVDVTVAVAAAHTKIKLRIFWLNITEVIVHRCTGTLVPH